MKYEVKFSCGHTETVSLFGKTAERERKLQYFADQGLCSHCYQEWQQAQAARGCEAVELPYKLFKTRFRWCKKVADSYNADTKTIKVFVPEDSVAAAKAFAAGDVNAQYEALCHMIPQYSNHLKYILDDYPVNDKNFVDGLKKYIEENHPELEAKK